MNTIKSVYKKTVTAPIMQPAMAKPLPPAGDCPFLILPSSTIPMTEPLMAMAIPGKQQIPEIPTSERTMDTIASGPIEEPSAIAGGFRPITTQLTQKYLPSEAMVRQLGQQPLKHREQMPVAATPGWEAQSKIQPLVNSFLIFERVAVGVGIYRTGEDHDAFDQAPDPCRHH
ncbi:MAG: hypothetical protein WC911_03850 [Thermoleophilia bacterium]